MKKRKGKLITDYMKFIEKEIARASSKPRTRGKYKGHTSTNTSQWISALFEYAWKDIRSRNGRGIAYDENMAIAHAMGRALVVWCANVQRAKSYDANRPVTNRRAALMHAIEFRDCVTSDMANDFLMEAVWPKQKMCPPIGSGVIGGSFV